MTPCCISPACGGIRQVPFREFSAGFMTTVLAADEMIAAVELPLWPEGSGFGFHEFARRHGDFAIVGAAALIDVDGEGVVRRCALALCGVAPAPLRVDVAEATPHRAQARRMRRSARPRPRRG